MRGLLAPETGDFEAQRRAFQWQIPPEFNIAQAVCHQNGADDDAIALYYENHAGLERRYTFGQLREYANRLANALQAQGVDKGDRVAIILSQRPETAIAHIAIYSIGAIAVPLSILFGSDALQYRLENSGARVVITDATRLPVVEDVHPRLPELETLLVCEADGEAGSFWECLREGANATPDVVTCPDDPALLIYTSGTTGPPKGALVAHRSLIGNLTGFELSQNFYAQTGGLFWTPADWAWTGGLLDALLPALYYGKPVLGYEGKGAFDPERAFELMAKYGVRNAFIPPTAMKMLMQVPDEKRPECPLRVIMSAGEAVGEQIIHWAQEKLQVPVNEMWGQTEFNYLVGNCSAILPVKPGSMGRPYPGHWVEPIDEAGNPMPTGEIGELAAHRDDPVMFLGYWKNDEATRSKCLGEWFLTGDLGYRDEEGYLWFVGRKDDVISSAGYRIGPTEIEDCLIKHPKVAQAAVIGVPDELRGNIIKAYLVLAKGVEPSEELTRDIQNSVRNRLAAYEYPREIEYIDELPLTTTGKVRRTELREMDRRKRGQS
ncbi:MAG: AMP-binding protein [Gammaproteobacteria bacterium]